MHMNYTISVLNLQQRKDDIMNGGTRWEDGILTVMGVSQNYQGTGHVPGVLK